MKKYYTIALVLTAAGLVAMFLVTVALFSAGLERQRERSEQQMMSGASHVLTFVDNLSGGKRGFTDEDINQYLADLAAAAGFERIVVADDHMLAHWSSSSIIHWGDDLSPLMLDAGLFREAAMSGDARLTPELDLDGTLFKSLYFPGQINDEMYVVVIEVSQEYFAAANQFTKAIVVVSIALAVLLAALFVALVVLRKNAVKAQKLARRNEQLAFLGQASAELAHELKNPLAIIKSSADVLRKRLDPSGKEKVFGYLSEEIMRLSRLINDILSFSREKKLLREPFAAKDALVPLITATMEQYPGMVILNTLVPGLTLTGDCDAFVQVISNLVRNACMAMQGEGSIEISAVPRERKLDLIVADDGPGIAPDIAGNLFDPFVTGMRTGTGLGLAIVKALCEAGGWSITVDTGKQGGARFTITVPEELWQES